MISPVVNICPGVGVIDPGVHTSDLGRALTIAAAVFAYAVILAALVTSVRKSKHSRLIARGAVLLSALPAVVWLAATELVYAPPACYWRDLKASDVSPGGVALLLLGVALAVLAAVVRQPRRSLVFGTSAAIVLVACAFTPLLSGVGDLKATVDDLYTDTSTPSVPPLLVLGLPSLLATLVLAWPTRKKGGHHEPGV